LKYVLDYIQNYSFLLYEDTYKNYDKIINYFQSFRPKGILIYDSYNNPFFPYKEIILDKNTFDLPKYHNFLNKYFGTNLKYLPFHFYIELVNDMYIVLNTRNFLLKPLLSVDEDSLDENLKKYKEYIHICILGDSNSDIYTKELYMKIKQIIRPFFILFKWGNYISNYVEIMMGKNFFEKRILKF